MEINNATLDNDGKAVEELLSDALFNQLDPMSWLSSKQENSYKFATQVFPLLAEHFSGTKLDELTREYPWLTNLSMLSKSHTLAQIFQENPIRNLTILDVFAKLQCLRIFGSQLMARDSQACIYSELIKVISARRQNRVAESQEQRTSTLQTQSGDTNEDIMLQDFKEEWENFKGQNSHTLRSSGLDVWARVLDSKSAWLLEYYGLSPNEREGLCRQAMSAFLVDPRNIDDDGDSWPLEQVVESWTEIKNRNYATPIEGNVQGRLLAAWISLNFHSRAWVKFNHNIWSFCLAAGCSKADKRDPFRSLEILRDSVSRQFLYTTDLHNRISELNKQIISQQRMITALAYRNVLENVSSTNPGFNPTEKWRSFVEKMLENVGDKDATVSKDIPLKGLIDQHKGNVTSLNTLKQTANDLYGTLSRTIHHPSPSKDFDQYNLISGQFDQVQIKFMTAMKPLTTNRLADDTFDWEKERRRYSTPAMAPAVVPPVDQVADATEDQEPTTKVKKGKKKQNKK